MNRDTDNLNETESENPSANETYFVPFYNAVHALIELLAHTIVVAGLLGFWEYRLKRLYQAKSVLPLYAEMIYYFFTPKDWREELLGTVQEIYFEKYESSPESAKQWLVLDLSGSLYPLFIWRLKDLFSFKKKDAEDETKDAPDGWFEFLMNKTID